MHLSVGLEDPAQADVKLLLEAGEAYAAALYPAESNHFLDIEALREANVRFVVARMDSRAIGTGAIALNDGWAEIKRMWVAGDVRGSGAAAAIYDVLEVQASSAGIKELRLETGIHNHEALGFYRRNGFAETGPFASYRADPFSVFMVKTLAG